MRHLQHSMTIDAPRSAVWAALADLPGIAAWNPGVTAARWSDDARSGVGAGRVCETAVGDLHEQVIAWDDGERVVLEIHGDRVPLFRRGVANFQLAGDAPTTVTLDYELHASGGRVGEAAVAKALRPGLQALLEGLRDHVEATATSGR